MVTTTTNLSLNKPAVNDPTDEDLWGGQLNTNMDTLDSEAVLKTTDLDFADKVLSKAEVKDLSEDTNDLGNQAGAGLTIDYEDGHYQFATLTGNITSITINNLPTSGKVGFLSLELTQDGTGSRTLTLGAAFKTQNNSTITLATAAAAIDILRFETRDAGTTIFTYLNGDMS